MLAKSAEQKQTCQYIGVGDKPNALQSRGHRFDSRLLHKTAFGEPSGAPVIKYTHKPSRPSTGYYQLKSHKKVVFL